MHDRRSRSSARGQVHIEKNVVLLLFLINSNSDVGILIKSWKIALCAHIAVQNWPKTVQNDWRDVAVGWSQVAMHLQLPHFYRAAWHADAV